MTIETKPWDVTEFLTDDEAMTHYLQAAFEEGDSALIRKALNDVARARGVAELAATAGLERRAVYKALSEKGNPTLDTLLKLTKALGVKLSVAA